MTSTADQSPPSQHPSVRLLPATETLLHALRDDRARFGELIVSAVPEGWPEFPESIAFTLDYLDSATETDRVWSMQFFLAAQGELVGSGGFAAPPAFDEATGYRTVEIGYEIAPEFRGRGLGTGAAGALVGAARASGIVDAVVAHTLPGPNPSTGVLEALGFVHTGQQHDPEVGAVWEWRLLLTDGAAEAEAPRERR